MPQRGTLAYMPSPGEVEYREYDLPAAPAGGLLLETLVAGVCGSEIHIFEGRHPVLKSVSLGHEIVGRVAQLGAGVEADSAGAPLAVGDSVSVTYFRACRSCPACGRGEFALCAHALDGWLSDPEDEPHFFGTMSSHYVVDPRQWVFKLPDNVPPAVAASANCALAQVMNGLERLGLKAGETLVVQGCGGLGLYSVALAKERGVRVIAVDAVAARLARAVEFGADETIDIGAFESPAERIAAVRELTAGDGADAAIDVTGAPAAFGEGIEMLRVGGRLAEVGLVLTGAEATFDLGGMARRGITVVSAVRYEPRHLRESLEFLARNVDRLPLHLMIDGHYDLDQVEEAIVDSAGRKVTRAAIFPVGE
jgi:D-arabinose 1-dehydrogenase-like Zn-dependent alcohol dehydrogenase